MAKTDVKGETNRQQTEQQRGATQTRGGGLARRSQQTPSLFSLGPRDFFTATPFELMRRFTDEMDRAFENFGLSRGQGGFGEIEAWTPTIEVFEHEGNMIVRAELPGLNKEDVNIEMTDDGLIIQGERKREHEESREGFYRSERSYGRFYRLIPLPEDIDEEQVRASFNNGVLEVTVPVPERQQRRRQIPIEAEGKGAKQAATASQTKK